jgi:23S rRNA (uracil1939-C5)-methyltransferase
VSTSPEITRRLAELEEIEVTVEKLVAGGDGLARFEGIPLFIPRAAPGDRLRVQLVQRRPSFGRAEIVEILQPGEVRREPPCPHFDLCGGCDLQHIEDAVQPQLKAEAARETLRRLGGIDLPAEIPVVTGDAWGYRLRTQLRVEPAQAVEPVAPCDPSEAAEPVVSGDEGAGEPPNAPPRVGYYERGSHTLVPVSVCPVLIPELEATVARLPATLEEALATGAPLPRRVDLAAGDAGAIASAPKVPGLPAGEVALTVGELVYRYDAGCFFQAHRGLLGRLVELVMGDPPEAGSVETAGDPAGTAFDLYAGVGLFALPLARRYGKVVAVEGERTAARYARINARRNRLSNVEVEARAVESWLPALPAGAARVVVDPPRAGLAEAVRAALVEKRPRRLTYVSCHPATLARDLAVLARAFTVEAVTAIDLFPQTGHLETVVQLVRKE